jgi:hypothetical protein
MTAIIEAWKTLEAFSEKPITLVINQGGTFGGNFG